MLRDVNLKPVYDSSLDNIPEEFYVPILKNAKTFDRVSAYFSARAIASYARGLEYFQDNGQKFRIIISEDVSETDFNQIKQGIELKKSINDKLLKSLDEELTLEEEKNISNLAYFIANGVVELKIGFKTPGILHDKFGVVTDSDNNMISYCGSYNDTEAAIKNNSESFSINRNWNDVDGFVTKGIMMLQNKFDILWENKDPQIKVLSPDEVIIKKIISHDKGKVVVDKAILAEDAVVLDYDDQPIVHVNLNEGLKSFVSKTFYVLNIKAYEYSLTNSSILLNKNMSYLDCLKLKDKLQKRMTKEGHMFLTTTRFDKWIESKNLYIESRYKLGIELKIDDSKFADKYLQFKTIVNNSFERQLREKQMKDAFFMFSMQKAANFSVPGSGKTSSALAVYAYLNYVGIVDKVMVVGPKNSFGSWIDEFKNCFGDKKKLNLFNIHDGKYTTSTQKRNALKYDTGNCNLLLFNYESLETYIKEAKEIASKNTLLIYDEVHKVKSVEGHYASFSLDLSSVSNHTIVMTGTPIPNSYLDIYNMLHILFNDEYDDFFKYDPGMLSNPYPLLVEDINKKIQPFFCRTTKQQLQVPLPNADEIINVDSTNDEQKLYDIVCKTYRKNKLALAIRLLQLESNPKLLLSALEDSSFEDVLDLGEGYDDTEFKDYSDETKTLIDSIKVTTKKMMLIQKIKELVADEKPVVVWCVFRDSIKSISKMLDESGISNKYIMGEISDLDERNQLISDFKNGKYKVLITNPHTLAESISLHNICHDAIYFEYTYNLVHLLQSKDRIHRLGLPQNQYTQFYYLNSIFEKNGNSISIDNRIYQRLKEKEKVMLNAIDNQVLEPVFTSDEDIDVIFKGLL